jgi:hypothetical protein
MEAFEQGRILAPIIVVIIGYFIGRKIYKDKHNGGKNNGAIQ